MKSRSGEINTTCLEVVPALVPVCQLGAVGGNSSFLSNVTVVNAASVLHFAGGSKLVRNALTRLSKAERT